MCLIAFAWQSDPRWKLVVAANRDEWRERPAEPAAWWPDHPRLLAGRDLQAGGTWLGVTAEGRFAALTNFRDPSDKRPGAPSRGELVTRYLLGHEKPEAFLAGLAQRAKAYAGFNLLAGDGETLFVLCSREPEPRAIEPGVHALSNHRLDEPWPKVRRAREAMAQALADADPEARLFGLLGDAAPAADGELPDTGVGLAWERRLSPPLILGPDYGTRASTVVRIGWDGTVRFEERTRDEAGHIGPVRTFDFACRIMAAEDNKNGRQAPWMPTRP